MPVPGADLKGFVDDCRSGLIEHKGYQERRQSEHRDIDHARIAADEHRPLGGPNGQQG